MVDRHIQWLPRTQTICTNPFGCGSMLRLSPRMVGCNPLTCGNCCFRMLCVTVIIESSSHSFVDLSIWWWFDVNVKHPTLTHSLRSWGNSSEVLNVKGSSDQVWELGIFVQERCGWPRLVQHRFSALQGHFLHEWHLVLHLQKTSPAVSCCSGSRQINTMYYCKG